MYLIYGKPDCKYCIAAKDILLSKNKEFKYFSLGADYTREELIEKCSPVLPRTVPQIFLLQGDKELYIGGFDDLQGVLSTEV